MAETAAKKKAESAASASRSAARGSNGADAPADTPEPAERLSEPQSGDDARTIHQRMVAVLDELPAIGKDQENTEQRFHFRGHDQILNALNPLLAKHGLFVLPNVIDRVYAERRTRSGATMYEVNLHVQFTFYGVDGSCVVASTWGEGTDMGDKATNKAMTMAFKNVLNQAFSISTEEMSYADADAGAPEPTTSEAAAQAQESRQEAQRDEKKKNRRDRIAKLCIDLDKQTKSETGTWHKLIEQESLRAFGVEYGSLSIEELEEVGKTLKAKLDSTATAVPEQLEFKVPF